MADNPRPGPLPPNEPGVHPSRPEPIRMAQRFAKKDPQLYPLAIAVTGIVGVAAWFLLYKKPAELSNPAAVGGLPHSPELSKARMEEWKQKPSVHDINPEKDVNIKLPSSK